MQCYVAPPHDLKVRQQDTQWTFLLVLDGKLIWQVFSGPFTLATLVLQWSRAVPRHTKPARPWSYQSTAGQA